MLNSADIAIVSGARTPMGRYCGKLRDFTAMELGAVAASEAIRRAGVEPGEFDHCVIGNAQQTSGDALYGARHVSLRAGLPIETPALTVNRLCGSGMQAIVSAAQMVQLGEAKTVLAGGMESMSQAPHVIRGARWGLGLGEGKMEDSLMVALLDTYCGLYMANTAELYGEQQGITREMQDEFALRSQKLAGEAQKACRLQEEITPVPLKNRKGEPSGEMFDKDDHLRPETTLDGLAKLKPAFGKNGSVTAGNASGIVDGGAAVVVMSMADAEKRGLTPMARIVSWGIAGVEPKVMGRGPVPATHMALQKAGLQLHEIDLVEVNEAFAAQYLAVEKELGLNRNKVNVNGGAIALGHPLGATGTRLVITLMYELRRRNAKYGLATACIGGGQGIAMIVENLHRD
ncbi:MAG: acetyl-CoA C-acetyltransferase [Acidobacteria bacterium]|nr:acetyl-CoA C-acetyltransferase [Acidobacteriaceae bacterium]MBV9608973.1 acetyl-CoA C-acetyltransferase [Acidobacteriota bacterium]